LVRHYRDFEFVAPQQHRLERGWGQHIGIGAAHAEPFPPPTPEGPRPKLSARIHTTSGSYSCRAKARRMPSRNWQTAPARGVEQARGRIVCAAGLACGEGVNLIETGFANHGSRFLVTLETSSRIFWTYFDFGL